MKKLLLNFFTFFVFLSYFLIFYFYLLLCQLSSNSSVLWQKSESQNGGNKNTKHTKFFEKRTFFFYRPIFSWHSIFFEIIFWFVFKESTLQCLKKIEGQIIVFNKKAVVKICRISNSKSLPWSLVKFRSEFFLVDFSRIVYWIFF